MPKQQRKTRVQIQQKKYIHKFDHKHQLVMDQKVIWQLTFHFTSHPMLLALEPDFISITKPMVAAHNMVTY